MKSMLEINQYIKQNLFFLGSIKNGVFTSKVMDIEELVKVGEKWNTCPYYASRDVSKQPECGIIFTPYNYLLNKKSRSAQNLEIAGNIIIFDEAHNLVSIN